MKSVLWILVAALLATFPLRTLAQYTYEAETLNQVFGTQTGCVQYAADKATQHRSAALSGWKRYKIYGYNPTTFEGETILCAMGPVTINVLSLSDSQVGSKIFAGLPEAWLAKGEDLYLSCVSTSADSMKFDVCPLK